MKRVWSFFSSIWLTIVLAALICVDAAWGSILAVWQPEAFRALDRVVLVPALIASPETGLFLWIYILIFLIFLFAINTFVCTADRVYAIVKQKSPWQSFFPHIVHIGFLVALLGHLTGNVAGFKSYGNILYQGEQTPVPQVEGLSVRLDKFDMKQSARGETESLRTRVTLLKNGTEVKNGDIEVNSPLIYDGIAFYHLDQGVMPVGLILDVAGEKAAVRFYSSAKLSGGGSIALGAIYPDFALDGAGRPQSRSDEYRNPHIEVIYKDAGGTEKRAFLNAARQGNSARLGGKAVTIGAIALSQYVVLNVSKDPGIWLIIAGSVILTIGMALLLFLRGKRSELVKACS
ncbi:MAG: cytochrome c biogenesis protein ResB [Deltaproteobacteria bacterium]|nr:cytochrome c biogenesis protein ResB [Deltaproteobacteria bacterium]